MSDNPVHTQSKATETSEWGVIVVSVLAIGTFLVTLYLVWRVSDQAGYHDVFVLMATTSASGFTLGLGYWLGSSRSSARKTELMSQGK